MKILVINLDKGILGADSKSLERLKEYSNLVEKIFVIVWSKGQKNPIIFQNKLFVIDIGNYNYILLNGNKVI